MSTAGVSRRTVLLGASALALTGCAKAPITITTPTATPSGPIRAQLTAALQEFAKTTDKLGVALHDRTTNKRWDFHGDYASQSASMAKVMITAMALRKARAAGGDLSFENFGHASKAIMFSDNDAADALWAYADERPAYDKLAAELGMAKTHSDSGNAFWSWTWTTPLDQLTLMDALLDGTTALTDDDRLYLLDLMGKVTAAHRWGVGNPSIEDDTKADVKVQMKNGWVQFKSSDGLWAVNSVGHVSGLDRDYTAAMMCRVDSFEKGKRLLDAIGAELFATLGRGPLE